MYAVLVYYVRLCTLLVSTPAAPILVLPPVHTPRSSSTCYMHGGCVATAAGTLRKDESASKSVTALPRLHACLVVWCLVFGVWCLAFGVVVVVAVVCCCCCGWEARTGTPSSVNGFATQLNETMSSFFGEQRGAGTLGAHVRPPKQLAVLTIAGLDGGPLSS